MKKRTFLATALPVLAACLGLPALAQPRDKPIRMIVGFPPGQATDLIARVLADMLGRELAQPVIVENRPGQGGSLALAQLAGSAADGSVITVSALAAYAINPALYKNVAYDTLRDLAPIGMVADIPTVLVTGADSGITSYADLVAKAKANPGMLKHCSSGNGTVSHLGMQELKRRAGIDMVHVPYQGSARAMTDLVSGQVQVGLDSVAAVRQLVEGKRLRVLAAASPQRLPAFPGVPTLSELGVPQFEVSAWTAVSVPSATPREVRQRLSDAVHKVVSSPEFARKMEPLGASAHPATAEEFARFLRTELPRWHDAVVASGAKVE